MRFLAPILGGSIPPDSTISKKTCHGMSFCFLFGNRTAAGVNAVPVARQSRSPARSAERVDPPDSTKWTLHEHLFFQRRICHQGVAVMSKQKIGRQSLL